MLANDVVEVQADIAEAARKVWYAGLGAVAMAQDESAKMFTSLVAVGEELEKQLRKQAKTIPSPAVAMKDATHGAEEVLKKAQAMFDAQLTSALHHLGVPTRDEIAQLTQRIEELTASIESLRARG